MSKTYSQTALYFEDRAKQARYMEERMRFLELAQKYRDLAAGIGRETELPKRPTMKPLMWTRA